MRGSCSQGGGWFRLEKSQPGKMWGSDMAGGPWLSGSGRAKAKDPRGDGDYVFQK